MWYYALYPQNINTRTHSFNKHHTIKQARALTGRNIHLSMDPRSCTCSRTLALSDQPHRVSSYLVQVDLAYNESICASQHRGISSVLLVNEGSRDDGGRISNDKYDSNKYDTEHGTCRQSGNNMLCKVASRLLITTN